jgi:hypothetical protein
MQAKAKSGGHARFLLCIAEHRLKQLESQPRHGLSGHPAVVPATGAAASASRAAQLAARYPGRGLPDEECNRQGAGLTEKQARVVAADPSNLSLVRRSTIAMAEEFIALDRQCLPDPQIQSLIDSWVKLRDQTLQDCLTGPQVAMCAVPPF